MESLRILSHSLKVIKEQSQVSNSGLIPKPAVKPYLIFYLETLVFTN